MCSKEYFDKVARQWDQIRTEFFSEKVREKAFSLAAVQPGQLAADIGAGTGYITEGLIQIGLNVIAIDQSEEMLNVMREKFTKALGIEYRLGDADQIPIPDATVDYVFANMLLHHVEIPVNSIREMVRILKVGGKLVITDLDEHQFEFLRTEQKDHWLGFKRSEIQRWLKEARLENVHVESTGETCSSEPSTGQEEATISIFVAIGTKMP